MELDSKPDIPTVESTIAAFAGGSIWGIQLEEMASSTLFVTTSES